MRIFKSNKCLDSLFSVAVFLILAFSVRSFAQDLTVRNAHSMVYDSKHKRVLLFGGADEKQVYGDLWKLENNVWKMLEPKNDPEPRTFASFVYDEKRKKVILFGGNGVLFGSDTNPAKFYNDTWELKGDKWRKLNFKNSPEPRAEAAIVYDKAKERIILFGGYNLADGKLNKFSDTWELKDKTWRKLNEGDLSARNGAALAFDSKLNKVVLFGGSTINKDYGENTGETWVLEKDSWQKLDIKQPANIFNSNMVYQENVQRLFRFGGWNGTGRTDETWVLDKNNWTKLDLESEPKARNHSATVFNSKTNETILFGGHDGTKIFGDLWIFRQGKWYKEFETPPIERIDNGH